MIKELIRKLLILLHIDLTKNIKYDRLTLKILNKVLHRNSNGIDIGCFKGEILDEILKRSPSGEHKAFEPVPESYNQLAIKYDQKNVSIYNIALNDKVGVSSFNYVIGAPAYSGIKKRDYDGKNPEIKVIDVKTDTLDNILSQDYHVDLIKIDVEGAEFNVLKGAYKTISRCKPVIIFEFGLGASDYYNVTPNDFYEYISNKCGYEVYLLESFLKNTSSLSKEKFEDIYNANKEYYFVASPLK